MGVEKYRRGMTLTELGGLRIQKLREGGESEIYKEPDGEA